MAAFEPLHDDPGLDGAVRVRRGEALEASIRSRRTMRPFADTPAPAALRP